MPRVPDGDFDTLALTLGKVIKVCRKRMRVSCKGLGAMLGMSGNTVSAWERGESLPSVPSLYLLSGALKVTLPEMFALVDKATTIWIQHKDAADDGQGSGRPARYTSRVRKEAQRRRRNGNGHARDAG